jgi:GNAT superfamily N-acetyltransferase
MEFAESDHLLFAAAIESEGGARGLVIVTHATWESDVLSRAIAKVSWIAADNYEIARALANAALRAAREKAVVLLSVAPGHAPTYMHVALTDAGFHVGSQSLTLRADLDAIATAVARIPLRGTFREATARDTEAVVDLARHGFVDARFTGDPFFPVDWGRELFAAWARNLMLGGADSVIVAEAGGRAIGFVSMTLDSQRRAAVPSLLAIDARYNGWGVGAMLIRTMFDWYRERGLKVFIAGTEKNNTPINALYLRIGASFVDSNIVYHATPALR